MKAIISNNKAELQTINKKINDWMKINISNYRARQWGKILSHPTNLTFALIINHDSRNPLGRLTANEKVRYIDLDISEWIINTQP